MTTTALPFLTLVAWLVALIELILGLYVLTLNFRQYLNRVLGTFLLFSALYVFATGQLFQATSLDSALWATQLVAATSLLVPILILWVTLAFLQPTWLVGRVRWGDWLFKGLLALFLLLTLLDVFAGTRLWYGGVPVTYTGGYIAPEAYVTGWLAAPGLVLLTGIVLVLAVGVSIYTALRDESRRSLGWTLALINATVSFVYLFLPDLLLPGGAILLSAGVILSGFSYLIFTRIVTQVQRSGNLEARLTALVLVIMIPLIAGTMALLGQLSSDLLVAKSSEQLEIANDGLAESLMLWLDLNYKALEHLSAQPDIVSMDPERQRPHLQAFAKAFPYMYLVSTTNLQGINLARNDEIMLTDYSDRAWFRTARTGAPALQVLQGRTGLAPALVVAMPIRTETQQIVGVVMFAASVTTLSDMISMEPIGSTGEFFIVDDSGLVLLHSAVDFTEVQDYSAYPPVLFAQRDTRGELPFTDTAGVRWQAFSQRLSNGWTVVFQIRHAELLLSVGVLQQLTAGLVITGVLLLVVLILVSYRQALRPIRVLTEAATEIAAGAIEQEVLVDSEDELGVLANAFNAMTAQLRSLIGSLEGQVQARTRDLERRAGYLEAAAEVSRVTTSLTETETLLQQAVQLIQEHFGLYYVGLFLVDAEAVWAELRAATGGAGAAMLARQHRLKIGPGSMIGWSVENAQARVALEVGADGVRLATAELPDTRSEAALPLRSRGRVVGAISVQHVEPGAFDAEAIAALQVMADQLGAALDNAALLEQSRQALADVQRAYGDVRGAAWRQLLGTHDAWGYRYTRKAITVADGEWRPEMLEAVRNGQSVATLEGNAALLAIPLAVRGQPVGVLHFRRAGRIAWTAEERSTLELLVERLSEALEGAQLYQETQQLAAREQLLAGVTARMRETLDVETVLKTAAGEMRQALELPEVSVRLVRLDA